MPKPRSDYEARRGGGLRDKFVHLGIFKHAPNARHTDVFAFRPYRNAAGGRWDLISRPRA